MTMISRGGIVDNFIQSESIIAAIENAPRPMTLAQQMLEHLNGNGRKKLSTGQFYDPNDEAYDAIAYCCWLIGLIPECQSSWLGSGALVEEICTNTGYCYAQDGSKELMTRVVNTVLGHDPYGGEISNRFPDESMDRDFHLISQNKAGDLIENDDWESNYECKVIDFDFRTRAALLDVISRDNDPLPYMAFTPRLRRPMHKGQRWALDDQQPKEGK